MSTMLTHRSNEQQRPMRYIYMYIPMFVWNLLQKRLRLYSRMWKLLLSLSSHTQEPPLPSHCGGARCTAVRQAHCISAPVLNTLQSIPAKLSKPAYDSTCCKACNLIYVVAFWSQLLFTLTYLLCPQLHPNVNWMSLLNWCLHRYKQPETA